MYSLRMSCVWGGHIWCLCVYCLCLAQRESLSTWVLVQSLTTANREHRPKVILNPSSMWRTMTSESWYSFYWIGWVNPDSKRSIETNFCHCWDSDPQPLDWQSSIWTFYTTTRPPPLHKGGRFVCYKYLSINTCMPKRWGTVDFFKHHQKEPIAKLSVISSLRGPTYECSFIKTSWKWTVESGGSS